MRMHEALQNLKAIVPLLFSILHVIIIMSDPRLEDDLIRRSYFRSLEREKKEDVETEIKATKHLMSDKRGPMHTFNGHSSDFYITQHGCSKGSPKVDADYFCRSFYGCAYTPTSYKVGSYSDSNRTGWQMHKNIGCSGGEGEEVDETDCDGAKCKIWETTKELQGLYNIVCVVSSVTKCFCEYKNGGAGENGIMCGTADGRCAVRDEQNAGNCESDQLCSGTADPSNAVPESDKNELCVKEYRLPHNLSFKSTFDDSVKACKNIGMVLIMPYSKNESEDILKFVKKNGLDNAWFSKTTSGPNGHKYADGSMVSYKGFWGKTWANGNPSVKDEIACAYIAFDGLWHDVSGCDSTQSEQHVEYAVCQRTPATYDLYSNDTMCGDYPDDEVCSPCSFDECKGFALVNYSVAFSYSVSRNRNWCRLCKDPENKKADRSWKIYKRSTKGPIPEPSSEATMRTSRQSNSTKSTLLNDTTSGQLHNSTTSSEQPTALKSSGVFISLFSLFCFVFN